MRSYWSRKPGASTSSNKLAAIHKVTHDPLLPLAAYYAFYYTPSITSSPRLQQHPLATLSTPPRSLPFTTSSYGLSTPPYFGASNTTLSTPSTQPTHHPSTARSASAPASSSLPLTFSPGTPPSPSSTSTRIPSSSLANTSSRDAAYPLQ